MDIQVIYKTKVAEVWNAGAQNWEDFLEKECECTSKLAENIKKVQSAKCNIYLNFSL